MSAHDLTVSNEWRVRHVLGTPTKEEHQAMCESPNGGSSLVYQGVASVRLEDGTHQDFVLTVFQHNDLGLVQDLHEWVVYASHISDSYHLETRLSSSELGIKTTEDVLARRVKIKAALSKLEIQEGKLRMCPSAPPSPAVVHDIGVPVSHDQPQLHSPAPSPVYTGFHHAQAQDEAYLQGVRLRGGVRIRVVTWNMHAKAPPEASELRKRMLPPDECDCFVIGTEECENSIAMSALKPSKERWESVLRETFGPTFEMLCGHTLQATHCIVFIRRELVGFVTNLRSAAASTGIGYGQSRLGNKGAVAISFCLGDKSFLFINAHLAHARQGLQRRNAEFHKISKQLTRELLGAGARDVPEDAGIQELVLAMDYVVWAGDLNYRLEMERDEVMALLFNDRLPDLLEADQLVQARRQGLAFQGLEEAAINFQPTYKYDDGTNQYDTSKKLRTPAWTDRILYKSTEHFQVQEYTSIQEILMSDHRPVYLTCMANVALGEYAVKTDGFEEDNVGKNTSQVCAIM